MESHNTHVDHHAYKTINKKDTTSKFKLPALPSLFRFLGAFFVTASGVIYLLQGLAEANMLMRYWVYLGLMLVLSIGGFVSHKYMQDDKGARLFFGLATLLVPIQFTQLGAMIYSWLQPDGSIETLKSTGEILLFGGLSLLLGSVATYSGLSILVRPYAKKLTIVFLLFNTLLLLPQRDLLTTAVLATLTGGLYLYLHTNLFKQEHRFQLLEGRASRLLMLSPILILLARASFHITNDLGIGMMMLEVALVNQLFFSNQSHSKVQRVLALLSYLLASFAWLIIAETLFNGYRAPLRAEGELVIFTYAIPLLLIAANFDLRNQKTSLYRLFGSIVYGLAGLLIWLNADMFSTVLFILVTTSVILYGYRQQSLSLLGLSSLGLIISLIQIVSLSIDQINVNVWLSLAIVGVALVATSSVLERYGQLAKNQFSHSLQSLKSWRY